MALLLIIQTPMKVVYATLHKFDLGSLVDKFK